MSKVKVAVRVRPINRRELELNTPVVIDMNAKQTVLESSKKGSKNFTFDYCFWSMDPSNIKFASQEKVFECLGMDLLDNAFEGYNACIFAYGQTGSGKSYTMMGTPTEKGIIPRLCDTIFERIDEKQSDDSRLTCKVEVSYMEIYNEKVRDLLNPQSSKHNLRVREHKVLGPYVDGLSKLAVTSFSDIEKLMDDGNKARTVAATNMNEQSSRSHAVFNLVMTQTYFDPSTQAGNEKVSKLSLVDLAGSERAGKTGAEGARLKEGSNINKSLTTLGIVISSLADASAGKKKGSFVPYRDSILTWLLKDNLGGNSKTVMVATISPAGDNYEETLSTLRYADRAKRIVNNAIINEDSNSRVIRELREELDRLRALITSGGGGAPGSVNHEQISELQEKLQISERLMKEMTLTWEQKLANTEKIHRERQQVLENMGISVHKAGIALESGKFYLVNLNADPSLSEMLVYYLKEHTVVGKSGSNNSPDILLRGLGIQAHHCDLDIVDNDVTIMPIPDARTCVNGRVITEPRVLCNGDRILWGNNHFFRVSCSRQPPEEEVRSGQEAGAKTLVDYNFARRELDLQELQSGDLSDVVTALAQKHTAEKQDALDEQRQMYESKLSDLRRQLGMKGSEAMPPRDSVSTIGMPTSTSSTSTPRTLSRAQTPTRMLSDDEEAGADLTPVRDLVLTANSMVWEANQLSEEMGKDTKFSVALQLPKNMLSPRKKDASEPPYEVVVNVVYKTRGTHTVWTVEKLEDKLVDMREMYEKLQDGALMGDLQSQGPDPFYELESHTLIGVANIFLDCLLYNVPLEYSPPIIDPRGEVCGRLSLDIQRAGQGAPSPNNIPDGLKWEQTEEDELHHGNKLTVNITIQEATGLPQALCHFVFCQYLFYNDEQEVIVPPFREASSKPPQPGKVSFQHTSSSQVVINEDFINYLTTDCLSVEVWGHRSSGFGEGQNVLQPGMELLVPQENAVSGRQKTLGERWQEVMRRMELWVEILELNDYGEYVPVELTDRPDVRTGGIFLLRQGQSRRVQVAVSPVRGSGLAPITCQSILSVSMGAVIHQNKQAISLDSYQDQDLQRLRQRWSDALMRRRAFLDDQIHKIVDKKDRSRDDSNKESELIDEWTQLQIERHAVVEPAPGTGVPGAPSVRNRFLPPGMETRIPTIFMDVSGSIPADGELIEVGDLSLAGQDDQSMVELPMLQRNNPEKQPLTPGMEFRGMDSASATASWDTSVHDNQHLNMQTNNTDRVYMVVKVRVKTAYPPNYVVILQKRICLKIYRKLSLGTLMKKKLASKSEERHRCGVTFEVVYGIPKQAGMDRPSTPTNFPPIDDDGDQEIVLERYSHGMSSVQSILSLDRLRQELAVKERLAAAGRIMKPRPMSSTPSILPQAALTHTPASITAETPDHDKDEVVAPTAQYQSRSSIIAISTIGSSAPTPPLKRSVFTPPRLSASSRDASPSRQSPGSSNMVQEAAQRLHELNRKDSSEVLEENVPTIRHESPSPVVSPASIPTAEPSADEERASVSGDAKTTDYEAVETRQTTDNEEHATTAGKDDDSNTVPKVLVGCETLHGSQSSEAVQQDVTPHEDAQGESTQKQSKTPAVDSVQHPGMEAVPASSPTPVRNQCSSPAPVGATEEHSGASNDEGELPVTEREPHTQGESVSLAFLSEDNSSPPMVANVISPSHTSAVPEVPVSEKRQVDEPKTEFTESGIKPADMKAEPVEATTEPAEVKTQLTDEKIEAAETKTELTDAQIEPADAKTEPVDASTGPGDGKTEPATPKVEPVASCPVEERRGSEVSDAESVPSTPSTPGAESPTAAAAPPVEPLPKVNDPVLVDISKGQFKVGIVKYVGTTEFAPGDWIGVALDMPKGNHDGQVKGKRYFKCKAKCGVFVKMDKITKAPTIGSGSAMSARSNTRRLSGRAHSPSQSASVATASASTSTASASRKKSLSSAGSSSTPSYLRGTAASTRRSSKNS